MRGLKSTRQTQLGEIHKFTAECISKTKGVTIDWEKDIVQFISLVDTFYE